MSTENRSSNTEMVSVPRELTPEFHVSYEAYEDSRGECPDSQWRAMLRAESDACSSGAQAILTPEHIHTLSSATSFPPISSRQTDRTEG